ncbi:hypothetical protein D7Y27_43405, partial [Corallococcus sp. AB004]
SSRALRSRLDVPNALTCLLLEELGLDTWPTSTPDSGVSSRNLAYVDFTSGSTGRPKGVAIEHRSVLRLFHGNDFARFGPDESFLLIAPISFDASTLEVWGPLLFGGRLVVFPPQSPSDLKLLRNVIEEHRVTTLHLTAGLLTQVVDLEPDALKGLRQVLTGGDVVSAPHVRRVVEQLALPVTACLEDGQQRNDELDGALEAEGDEVIRPDAVGAKGVGQLVGLRVELPVGEALGAELDGDGVRAEGSLVLEEVVDAAVSREGGGGGVEVAQQLTALLDGEQRDIAQA